uniref:Peroxisomal trans-2-enoyl-CoA reductase n=1 Tax=Talaromyces marneffei PM1 TaxID=1077442 RepID=A0A093UNT0_TALMA
MGCETTLQNSVSKRLDTRMPPFPTLTKTWHSATYPATSPLKLYLSAAGKTILITGGGGEIGVGITRSFAVAGSTQIAIVGRWQEVLASTARELENPFKGLKIDAAFDLVIKEFEPIDDFVDNAGYISVELATELDSDGAWAVFATNMSGSIYTVWAFSRTERRDHAVVIDVSSIAAIIPPIHGGAAYSAIDLPGQFAVWLASPEADFLHGKFEVQNDRIGNNQTGWIAVILEIAFSTVVADGQFSTLGTVLVAALAQTKRVILPLPLRLRRDLSVKQKKALSLPAQTHTNDMESDFGVPIRRAVEPSKEKEVVSMPNISEKKSSKRSSDAEDVATPPPAKDATTKVKKSKSKKKKSGNAIDDIFGALK